MAEQTVSTDQALFTTMNKCLLDPTEMLGNIAIRELDIVLMKGGDGRNLQMATNQSTGLHAPGVGIRGDFCISILKFNRL